MLNFLVIGHITRDVLPAGGFAQGGTATYAAVTAQRLGVQAAILTRAAPDFPLTPDLDDITLERLPSADTTTFENRYFDGHRRQVVHTVAPPLTVADVPAAWRTIPIVLLGPIAQEVDPALASAFPGSLLGVVPQGWMRRWDAQGHVSRQDWESAAEVLAGAQALILSDEDLGHSTATLAHYRRLCPLVVLTLGARGCQVWQGDRMTAMPPRPAHEVDPTGAGDVFAAAFLIRLAASGDPLQAARFANVAASFSVEGQATHAIPSLAQVETWLTQHPIEAQSSL
ncbi:MAG: ribokinase [Anaerolineae bacterium]|nr:ribokinase [Anaerolineae bacterium]